VGELCFEEDFCYMSSERRTEDRTLYKVDFECYPVGAPDVRWKGSSVDISDSGINLLISRTFERGTNLVVNFDDGSTRIVQVMRKRKKKHDWRWHHGCLIVSMANNFDNVYPSQHDLTKYINQLLGNYYHDE
jgi:hypothetical protein